MVSSEALTEIVFVSLEVWAFVFSVVGNSVVIYVMSREKKLRRKSNYYIISVAIADILIGLVGIPCSIYMVKSGLLICLQNLTRKNLLCSAATNRRTAQLEYVLRNHFVFVGHLSGVSFFARGDFN